jgi:hypothetical protein
VGTVVQADEAADDLSRKATDPTASLMAYSLLFDYTGDRHGDVPGPDDSLDMLFRPVIPFKAFGTSNILRLTLPYRLSGPGEDGLGDVSLFDLLVFNAPWGRWGVGPVMTFVSADAAPDDFAIGPAIGGVWQYSKRLNLGLFNQNVFAEDTAISQLQPIIAYQLGGGWSLSAGDLQFVYDWQNSRWLSIPIGLQLGKVLRIAGQPIRLAINPQYNFKDDDGLDAWKLVFTLALLVPSG